MKTKIATLLLITTTYFASSCAYLHEHNSLPLFQSASGVQAKEKKCTPIELEFTNKVGDDLSRISKQENVYEQVRSSVLLLQEILNNRLVSDEVKITLFEVVQEYIRTSVKEQVNNEKKLLDVPTKSLSGMTKCSPTGNSAMNIEVVGNVNATSEEFQEMLANLSMVGNRLKQAKQVSNAISIGKIVLVSLLASLAGCGVVLAGVQIYKKLKSDQGGQQPQHLYGPGGYPFHPHFAGQYPHQANGPWAPAGSAPYAQPPTQNNSSSMPAPAE